MSLLIRYLGGEIVADASGINIDEVVNQILDKGYMQIRDWRASRF